MGTRPRTGLLGRIQRDAERDGRQPIQVIASSIGVKRSKDVNWVCNWKDGIGKGDRNGEESIGCAS